MPEIPPIFLVDDGRWFSSLERVGESADAHRLSTGPLPEGWRRLRKGMWTHLSSARAAMPEQGWKIHVSCTPDDFRTTVDRVWDICRNLPVNWKFVSHPRLHRAINGKGSPRGSSGKVVTVYPSDEVRLRDLLARLEDSLAGIAGPYILSDLRWKDGPVHLRYGAFSPAWCFDGNGNRVPAMKDADGRLVPDVRGPTFAPPEWLSIPRWLAEGTGFERRDKAQDPNLHGYRVLRPLHFSNAGGVYLAEDRDGVRVVLKEARPYAGIDANGQDAVTRLHHEENILLALAGRPWAPRVRAAFTEWEHHYLVLDHLDGESLDAVIRREYPLTRPNPTPERRAAYHAMIQPLLDDLERVVGDLHECGYTFGDLTPDNVMLVDGGTRVALLDFETADPLTSTRPPNLVTRGFSATRPMTREEADWYSFACCQLWAYAPFNRLAAMRPAALGEAVDAMGAWFAIPPAELARTRARLRAEPTDDAPDTAELVPTIIGSATPDDPVQLYPGDSRSFADEARLGLAYGAPGVIMALLAAGVTPPDEHVGWLRHAVESASDSAPLGLYDGLGGAALALFRLSDPLYLKVIDRIVEKPSPEATSLFSGRTGLAHLFIETGDTHRGLAMAEAVHGRAGDGIPGGLMDGHAGAAMLFARCRRLTGDDFWRDAHLAAVDRALRAKQHRVQRDLGTGMAGIALALLSGVAWLPERHRETLRRYLDEIDVEVMPQGGLFDGHAGLAYVFAQAGRAFPEQRAKAHLWRVSRYLGSPGPARTALVGRQSARFSLDLASGSAGVVFAECTARDPEMFQLPGMELDLPAGDRR